MREFITKCCVCKKDLCKTQVFSDEDDITGIILFCNSCLNKTIDWSLSLRQQKKEHEESWLAIRKILERGGHISFKK